MDIAEYIGSTASFYRVGEGLVVKSLRPSEANKLIIEQTILERLGDHPYITKYRGVYHCGELKGLLFTQANNGDLQRYIDANIDSISSDTRKKWCWQIAQAVQHLHRKGVIHSDLRPENCLLHEHKTSLDIQLCDFGSSMCQALDLDGKGLPDPPFWDQEWKSTVGTDIFSLGSLFYTIMTGHWPYARQLDGVEEDKWSYEDRVIRMMKEGQYPSLEGVYWDEIIMKCWKKTFRTVDDIVERLKSESRE